MSKNFNKYITVCDYIDITLLVLTEASCGVSLYSFAAAGGAPIGISVSLYSFANVAGAPIGITSASISLAFLADNGIFKMYFKTMGRKRNKYIKIAFWLWVNSIA